jgi:hypothetical protein
MAGTPAARKATPFPAPAIEKIAMNCHTCRDR